MKYYACCEEIEVEWMERFIASNKISNYARSSSYCEVRKTKKKKNTKKVEEIKKDF